MRKIVEKLTPAVVEATQRGSSGHFELHFDKGAFTRAKQQVSL